MNIQIQGKHIEITPAVDDYIRRKIELLSKHIHVHPNAEVSADVEVGMPNMHHKKGDVFRAEINLNVDGKFYRAVATKADLYEAIDTVKDEIDQALSRDKDKKESLIRRGARRAKEILLGLRRQRDI